MPGDNEQGAASAAPDQSTVPSSPPSVKPTEIVNGAKSSDKKTEPKRSVFHVVGPGALQFDGDVYSAGEELQLTADEADQLGDQVRPGKAPRRATGQKRKAGIYKVAGPGAVAHGGRFHEAGALLELDEKDANELGDAVEEV